MKTTAIMAACLLLSRNLYADAITDLSIEQRVKYESQCLVARKDLSPDVDYFHTSEFNTTPSRFWMPYHGGLKIKESEFFQIAGMQSHAKKAAGYEMTGQAFIGLAVASVMWGLTALAAIDPEESELDRQSLSISIGLATITGSVSVVAGYSMLAKRRYSIEIAEAAADRFNSELLRFLSAK